ncbi:MAG: glycerol-3-phosphate dehydrogenase [Campylobacteraceae bacterium 4484_166]|nr:MAG: glycerol-3-phosphate dehydrogenase [Campylobacteraceae bacterium 4484_166]
MTTNNKFDYTAISDDCIKCGKCKPVCPIFSITGDETQSPRGFIDLLGAYKQDKLSLDKNAKRIFESCFLCTSCVEVCPNDLRTDMIIEQVRYDIKKKFGISWYKRLFFYLLRNRKVMDIVAKLGYVFQTCGIKIDEKKQSAKFRLNLPLQIIQDRSVPYSKKVSFINSHDEFIKNSQDKNPQRVAIFIGCMGNYAYTDIGKSLLEILNYLKIDVMIPKKQLCCGAPAYFTGDFDTVDFLIKQNITYFETILDDFDAIIIPEATCSAMIKIDWEHFLHDQPSWQKRAKNITNKVHMATKWLYENTKLKDILKQQNDTKLKNLPITYHDPCHAKKMQNIYKEPRELLKDSYDLKEMSQSDSCCGFGGVTMQTSNYGFAKQIGKRKADNILNSDAKVVSAECSACKMQITDSLGRTKNDIIFKNPIELIADVLRVQ